MRRYNASFLVCGLATAMLLFSVVASVGCRNGGNGNGGGEGAVVAMMERLTENVTKFYFVDVRAFRADNSLDEIYKASRDTIEFDFRQLGISAADVDTMAKGGGVTILEGSFSLGSVRDELRGNGYDDAEYKGIETWGRDLSVALVSKSCIVTGGSTDTLEDCIDAMKGDCASLYDNADARDVVGRLPDGLWTNVSFKQAGLDGLKAEGRSGDKKDADTIRMTVIYLFEDEDAAGNARGDIEDESADNANVEMTQDGKYVTVSADVAIEDVLL